MTVQKQQRQNKVLLRIRELKTKEQQQRGLDNLDDSEMLELQIEANKNGWIYW